MQIHTPYDGIRDADYDVHVNPGHGSPFAIIEMGNGCQVEMTGRRPDMERLMVAAATALAMLDAGERPHPWQDGGLGHCGACGRLRPDPVHDTDGARDDTRVKAEREVPRSLASPRCHRHPERAYGACPECSADIDAAIARDTLARDIAVGTPTLVDDDLGEFCGARYRRDGEWRECGEPAGHGDLHGDTRAVTA